MKPLLLLFVICCLVTGSEEGAEGNQRETPGEFFDLEEADLTKPLANTPEHPLADLETYIRQELSTKPYLKDREIGKVTRIEVQVVEGLNYRFTFTNSQG